MFTQLKIWWAKHINYRTEYTGENISLDTYTTEPNITGNCRVIDIKQFCEDSGSIDMVADLDSNNDLFVKVHGDQRINVNIKFNNTNHTPVLFTTTEGTNVPLLTADSKGFMPRFKLRVETDVERFVVDKYYADMVNIINAIKKLKRPHTVRANTLPDVKELVDEVGYRHITTYGCQLRADAYLTYLLELAHGRT